MRVKGDSDPFIRKLVRLPAPFFVFSLLLDLGVSIGRLLSFGKREKVSEKFWDFKCPFKGLNVMVDLHKHEIEIRLRRYPTAVLCLAQFCW